MATRTTRRARGGTYNGGGGLCPEGHDIPLHTKAAIHGKQTMNMSDAEGRMEVEGEGRLRSRHYQIHLFQHKGQRGEDAHRPPDGPGGATRGYSTEKRHLQNAEARLDD